jgi:two-component system sensor histidine kinase UhpB
MSLDALAKRAADVAIRILRGEPPADITSPTQRHGPLVYDWRELQRWGIREARLPAGSTVLYRQPGVWEQYRLYILAAATLVAVQSVLIAGLVVQRVRRRRTERALRDSELRFRDAAERNQDLAVRLMNAQEEERTRIARDLHDDVSQHLAGLGIMLSGLKRKVAKWGPDPDVDGTMATIQNGTSTLADRIRNLSHELHPSVLEHAGLTATLRRHCEDVEALHHSTVSFSADGDLDALGHDVALCLFRVAQEAVSNAVRHARAQTIGVHIKSTNEAVELEITDDGVGFVAGESGRRGLGLRSIDERVRQVGGSVIVESQPGHGTRIRARIPRARPAGADRGDPQPAVAGRVASER